ncbi:MAG: hypothetical protein OSA87_07155 [Woeseiaceae bacterium]|jgi:hypothetical protein|nr:hypothetical protein [Woeseiaceae bacterium]
MHYDHINVPADGVPITANPDHSLNVPNFQIIPLIEGDSIAPGTKLVGTRGCGEAIIRHTDD